MSDIVINIGVITAKTFLFKSIFNMILNSNNIYYGFCLLIIYLFVYPVNMSDIVINFGVLLFFW